MDVTTLLVGSKHTNIIVDSWRTKNSRNNRQKRTMAAARLPSIDTLRKASIELPPTKIPPPSRSAFDELTATNVTSFF
jgi:hypothetical protein